MNCTKHNWNSAEQCPICQLSEPLDVEQERQALEWHRTVFVELTAIATWLSLEPLAYEGRDLDKVAKECWRTAVTLWNNRSV